LLQGRDGFRITLAPGFAPVTHAKEAKMIALSTGAIVGLIIVLVILVAAFFVVFGRARR